MEDPEQGEIASPWDAMSGEAFQRPLRAQDIKTVTWNGRAMPRTVQEYLADLTQAYEKDAAERFKETTSPQTEGTVEGAPVQAPAGSTGSGGVRLPRFSRTNRTSPALSPTPHRNKRMPVRMTLLARHLADTTAMQAEIVKMASAFRADPTGPEALACLRRIHTLSRAFHRSARQSGRHAWWFGKSGSPQTAAAGLDHVQRLNALARVSLEGIPDQKKALERIQEQLRTLQRIIQGLLARFAPRKNAGLLPPPSPRP